MSTVNRYERGWPGHFICANRCRFRRNTLLECGESRVVVSTVGLMENQDQDGFDTIGHNRHFETMAFHAEHDGRYWDADVTSEVEFESPWAIAEVDADDRANEMHETVVQELMAKMAQESEGEQGVSEEISELASLEVEFIRTITNDPEVAHAAEKELWRSVLIQAAAGRDVEAAAKEALKTEQIDFPRWFA